MEALVKNGTLLSDNDLRSSFSQVERKCFSVHMYLASTMFIFVRISYDSKGPFNMVTVLVIGRFLVWGAYPVDHFQSIYTSFAMIHSIITRLYVCDHRKCVLLRCSPQLMVIQIVSELYVSAEEVRERFAYHYNHPESRMTVCQ